LALTFSLRFGRRIRSGRPLLQIAPRFALARFRVPGARPALLDCIGVTTAPLDKASRRALGVAGGDGLVVTSIDPDGPAAVAGIGVGDVLAANGGKVAATVGNGGASLVVARGKAAMRLPLALPDDCSAD